jgi:hypothetical protein
MAMNVMWIGLIIILIAIGVAIGVIVWSQNKKKHHSSSSSSSASSFKGAFSADDVQTGDITELTVVTGSTGASNDSGFLTVLSATVKTDCWTNRLYSNVSAFTSIGTVDGTALLGGTSVSSEVASIDVRVLVDGVEALPGTITFDAVTHVVGSTLDDDQFLLLVETRGSANSFDFVTRDVLPGTHTIEVQARAIASAEAAPALVSSALALIGDRSLVVQPGRVHVPSSSSSSSSSSTTTTL